MRNYLKIPKPLFITPSLLSPPPQPQPPTHKPNSPMFYYTIVVVATATIVLTIYHLVIIRLCTIRYNRSLQQQQPHLSIRNHDTPNTTVSTPNPSNCNDRDNVCLISSFKYKNQVGCELECSVCLSVFGDGEEVKRLPVCDHCFHASCIDMWLCTHFQCPLCRAPVVEQPPPSPPPSPQSFPM